MTASTLSTDERLARMTRAIVDRVRPRRIILFGSRALGTARADSDYDILVEIDGERRPPNGVANAHAALGQDGWDVDVIVKTAAEYAEERDDVGTLAFQVERDGQVLYRADGVESLPYGTGVRYGGGGPSARHVGVVREGLPTRPKSVALWIRRAESDYRMMRFALAARRPPTDGACFHAHQLVEKLLKAMIVAGHRAPPRTHLLETLRCLCPEPLCSDERIKEACNLLQQVWPSSRYPEAPEPTLEDARRSGKRLGLCARRS